MLCYLRGVSDCKMILTAWKGVGLQLWCRSDKPWGLQSTQWPVEIKELFDSFLKVKQEIDWEIEYYHPL